ncbi:ZIP Zinc transporter family protein [Coccidioides posadasii C735 delta SOWgp]|uniref:ZIP Zinc transporter family protein n=1 Tax=Coccidioides posadasii (strain C735) TaxID=222929 RepID=C5PBY8_COCP7|nr:ZIP Zinc transporter family protein [Coccidioides posadasii C735 delta SOWgp]EER25465.1 ZIP Zinc transporter family protein [Coccidioides posadasii C735 delta SOWgp]|eukprot:XP_003067610.1 ZIP Zinc transporter family protein [Coccidioides posadasii C735 delta SOWgp]
MGGLLTLLVLSTLMAVASFVVGSLPLSFTLSSSQLRLISALGMGVLVGTSLIVIVPEGVETLYGSTGSSHSHVHRRDVAAHGLNVLWNHSPVPVVLPRDKPDDGHAVPEPPPIVKEPPTAPDNNTPKDKAEPGKDSDNNNNEHQNTGEQAPKEQKEESSPHAWIGIGLISGFILMYLIDQLPQYAATSSKQQNRPYHISLDNLGSGLGRGVSPSRTGGGFFDFGTGARHSQSFATTTGLVIHAATDGIALGASSSNTSLSLIIFIAIMVHKAPASFGLTSVLLKQGLSIRAARGHLLVFSLAAPVGAILTWLVAHTVLAGHASDEQATQWRTGMLLLFSAGTFLYVAMHTMQENIMETTRRDTAVNGYNEGRESSSPKKSMRDLIASIVGMILPLFLQIGHA